MTRSFPVLLLRKALWSSCSKTRKYLFFSYSREDNCNCPLYYMTRNGILQARKEPLRVFMIEWEHYTTMAENFSVLTSPLCLDELSEAKRVKDTVGESTQRSLKPLLCNVWILSWKLETDFSWLRIWLSLVWIKFYCKDGHFKIWKFILTMKTNLTWPCKLVFGSGWI